MRLIVLLLLRKDKTWFISVDVLLIRSMVIVYLHIALAVLTIVANAKSLKNLKSLNSLKRNLYVLDAIPTSTVL